MAESWSQYCGQDEVCKIIVQHVLPCLKEKSINIELVYSRIDLLLTTHSDADECSSNGEEAGLEEEVKEEKNQERKETGATIITKLALDKE